MTPMQMDSRTSLLRTQQTIDALNQDAETVWRTSPQVAIDKAAKAESLSQDAIFGRTGYTAGLIHSRTIQANAYVDRKSVV